MLEADSLALTALALVRIGDVDSAIATIDDALRAAGGAETASVSVLRAAWIVAYESGDIAHSLDHTVPRDRGQSTVW